MGSIGDADCVVVDCDTPRYKRRNCEFCGDVVCWDHLTNFCNECKSQEYPFTNCGGNISVVCPDCADEAEEDLPRCESDDDWD